MKQKPHLLTSRIRLLVFLTTLWAVAGSLARTHEPGTIKPADPYVHETKADRDARMAWWRDAKFGLFIHWGVYAVPGGVYKGEEVRWYGEWIMDTARIPVAEYKKFAKGFNPVKYDPVFWAQLAKEAGMKYVVITAKHHDGFALYDSAVSDWDIAGTPYGKNPESPYAKDLLRPLLEAVHAEGLKMGFYYSHAQDWTHPGGSTWRGGNDYWDEAQHGDFDEYLAAIAVPQARELLSGYDLDVFWWDTPKRMTAKRAEPLSRLLHLRPGIITNNRLGGGFKGDTDTPEQHIPDSGFEDGRDWETCMTMNQSWGYKHHDHRWKRADLLVYNLTDIVSKGGNYLLNIGPGADGTIPEESIALLREVGAWMDVYGESIYRTQASPCAAPPWGKVTRRDGVGQTTLYLHLQKWPVGEELRLNLDNAVVSAEIFGTGRNVNAARSADGIRFIIEGPRPNPLSSVIKMVIQGAPVPLESYVMQNKNGLVQTKAKMAKFYPDAKGITARKGMWRFAKYTGEWLIEFNQPGDYYIGGTIHNRKKGKGEASGSAFDLTLEPQSGGLKSQARLYLPPREKNKEYKDVVLKVAEPGVYVLRLQPDPEVWDGATLNELKLIPVAKGHAQ